MIRALRLVAAGCKCGWVWSLLVTLARTVLTSPCRSAVRRNRPVDIAKGQLKMQGWNNFGTFEGEDWLPNNPKRRLNNDLWIELEPVK